MNSIRTLSPQQLRNAADLREKIEALEQELEQILGTAPESAVAAPPIEEPEAPEAPEADPARRRKRRLSPEGLANIRAGVAKRQARRGLKPAPIAALAALGPRRKMTPAGRRALSEAAKARWAKVKASGKSRL